MLRSFGFDLKPAFAFRPRQTSSWCKVKLENRLSKAQLIMLAQQLEEILFHMYDQVTGPLFFMMHI